MFFISIDIGGGSLKAILGDKNGNIQHNTVKLVDRSFTPAQLIKLIKSTIDELAKKSPKKIKCAVIGIPGLLDFNTGCVIRLPNLPNLEKFPIKEELEKKLEIPFLIENDANLAALGEAWKGSGKGLDNFLLVTLGTGIGGALFINGSCYRGENGLAGEIGHIKIATEGPECGCGGIGCLETFAGGFAIERRIQEVIESNRLDAPGDVKPDGAWLAERARTGRNAASAIYQQVGRALGRGIGSILMVLDLNAIIFVGGGAAALDLIKPYMITEMQQGFFGHDFEALTILRGQLGEMAGRIGGIKLALDNHK